jgi:ubiquinone/menaquinone biosynthesis C-methylase UbiE
MSEGFRPLPNNSSNNFISYLINIFRKVVDLQLLTIYKDAKKVLPKFNGRVLDVGCGDSPYKYLLNSSQTDYIGIDIVDADTFDYNNSQIIPFDGKRIPFDANYFDAVICTEVLEHVENFQILIDEMFRVMKPGAKGFITIPWSARFHYIPYDYFRYTPSSLKTMFSTFEKLEIKNRGTDLAVIANKLIVMWTRNIISAQKWKLIFLPFWIVFSPFLIFWIIIAHLSLLFHWGSSDDPLGYTIVISKTFKKDYF